MNKEDACLYEFGPYRLDPVERLLQCSGKSIPLTPKAFDTLLVLVENSGRLLEKEKLMQQIWPDSFVEEANLAHNISLLRKMFAENTPGEQYIETIPKRGYRFLVSVASRSNTEPGTVVESSPSAIGAKAEVNTSQRRSVWPAALLTVVAVSLMVLVGYRWIRVSSEQSSIATKPRSIAVLPFALVGMEPDDQYLGLGIADALITRLSKTRRIFVRPTSQVLKYKDGQDPAAAGRALRVDAVIDGSIRRVEDRLRVTIQLVSVKDGAVMWGDQFEENSTNLFAIEDAAMEKLVTALAVDLTPDERALVAKHHTERMEAYQAYVKGRYHLNWTSEKGLRRSIDYFEQAIRADPKYALAYAGLVDSYIMLAFYHSSSTDIFPQAKSCAEKALQFDPSLPEAQGSLGAVRIFFEWDWEAARKDTETAERTLSLSPLSAVRFPCYLHAQDSLGKSNESIRAIQRALSLDPDSLWLNAELGCASYYGRQFDLSIRQSKFVLDLDSNLIKAHYNLGRAYGQKALYNEALVHLKQARTLSEGAPHILGELGYVCAVSGRQREAADVIKELNDLGKRRYVNPYHMAIVSLGLGERDQVFTWLEKAYQERSTWIPWLNVDSKFDGLKSDPRFQTLIKRIGFTR